MEKLVNFKTGQYIKTFKDDIVDKLKNSEIDNDKMSDILKFVYEYPHMCFDKSDFQKRKRIKNTIPLHDRCSAVRANEEQCTRRRKDGSLFCGTHIKGTPHGVVNDGTKEPCSYLKINVSAEEICGIIYYIDSSGNVYDPQDIFQNIQNPRIIAHYKKEGDKYVIIN